MSVKHAKEVARRWVIEEASQTPGFAGAFLHGSVNWLADDATLPATSDIDVMVVLSGSPPQFKTGKFIYRDVLLEVSYLSIDRLQSPEAVLGNYQLASSLRTPSIIVDPAGRLTQLQQIVSQNFARHEWVRKRCEDALDKAQRDLRSVDDSRTFPEQMLAWLFGTGKTAHMLLVAGLKNPTVRRRYVSVHELLRDYGHPDLHQSLLETLGSAWMRTWQVEQHLTALADAFNTACAVMKHSFPFASDITMVARPIAIDGSRELIELGYHREAMFWIAVTYSRCQIVLGHDAPTQLQVEFSSGYRRLLNDLGITSSADLQDQSEATRDLLPRIWDVAEAIMAANPAIID